MPTSDSRRGCLRLLGAGFAAAWLPARLAADPASSGESCATDGSFTRPLYVAGADGWLGRFPVATDAVSLRADRHDDSLAFLAERRGRLFQNPTLVLDTNTRVRVELANALAEPTVAHWHGLTMDTPNDGNGESLIAPGGRFDYEFVVRNRAGMYWYHPHPHGATARQMHRGLFGLIEVDDDDDRAMRRALDLERGTTELTLVLQDRRPGDADRYAPAPEDELLGWYGCLPFVNGVLRPFHDVAARRHRLRILNAANARTYRLAFRRDDGTTLPFVLIGTDGGLLERGVRCEQALLSPAERIDVLVDFSEIAKGGFAIMETRAFDPMQAGVRATITRSSADNSAHGHGTSTTSPGSLADGQAFDLMQFRIRDAGARGPALPERLSRMPAILPTVEDARPLRLGFAKGRWRINDRVYDVQATPIEVARGARETWLLRNYHTSAPHAMHLHGYQFRVLERETSPDFLAPLVVDAHGRLPTDLGLKDTVLVWPGESVRIALDFVLPFAGPQVYLVHCHNLEHEDAGMMLRVKVG